MKSKNIKTVKNAKQDNERDWKGELEELEQDLCDKKEEVNRLNHKITAMQAVLDELGDVLINFRAKIDEVIENIDESSADVNMLVDE